MTVSWYHVGVWQWYHETVFSGITDFLAFIGKKA